MLSGRPPQGGDQIEKPVLLLILPLDLINIDKSAVVDIMKATVGVLHIIADLPACRKKNSLLRALFLFDSLAAWIRARSLCSKILPSTRRETSANLVGSMQKTPIWEFFAFSDNLSHGLSLRFIWSKSHEFWKIRPYHG